MCGRFAVTTDPARLAVELDAVDETATGGFTPNYNVAPTTDIAAVVSDDHTRRIRLMRWGLVPPWAREAQDGKPKDGKPVHPLINARAETVTTSPAFRAAAKSRRCLIPMDGYYEWKPAGKSPGDDPSRGRKRPFYFYRPDGAPLLVAGLWAGPPEAMTATIITTDAHGEFAEVHHRMPLVLGAGDWDRWLNPEAPAPADLLAGRPDTGPMAMREVSTLVNRVANNGPELIQPPGPGNQPVGLF